MRGGEGERPNGAMGHYGDRMSMASKKRYKESDKKQFMLFVSQSWPCMGPPKTPAPDVRIECESAGAPPKMAEEELLPDVVLAPFRVFA